MTTATITLVQSSHTMHPTHYHATCGSSTFDSGGLEDAGIQWWLQLDSDESVVQYAAGVTEFGFVIEDDEAYTLTLRVKGAGDSDWTEASEAILADTFVADQEKYIDPSAGVNGTGTSGSPFNSWASAFSSIRTNWVTNGQNVLYVKRGTSSSTATGFDTDSDGELTGRFILRPYDAGADPAVTYTGGTQSWIRMADNCACVLEDIDFNGNSASYILRKDTRGTESPDGLNCILLRCTTTLAGIFTTQADSGSGDPAVWSGGAFDFLAVIDHNAVSTSATINGYGLVEASRYVLYKNNTIAVYPSGGSIGIRFKTIQSALFMDNHHEGATTGTPWRIHSATAGVETLWVSIYNCWVNTEDVWFCPDDGNTVTEPMRHLWMNGLVVNATTQVRGIAAFATERLVMRNCWSRCGGPMLTMRSDAETISTYSNWIIENNSHVSDTNSAGQCIGVAWLGTPSDMTVRNNLCYGSAQTSNGLAMLQVTGSLVPSNVLSVCDRNLLHSNAGTPGWANGFSVAGTSLATWQGNTTFDDASSSTATSDFVAPTGAGDALDLTIGASSSAIGAGSLSEGAFVDYANRIRVNDVGSHERGATDEPEAPVLSGGGGGGSVSSIAVGSAPVPVVRSRSLSRSPWMQWPIWEK